MNRQKKTKRERKNNFVWEKNMWIVSETYAKKWRLEKHFYHAMDNIQEIQDIFSFRSFIVSSFWDVVLIGQKKINLHTFAHRVA